MQYSIVILMELRLHVNVGVAMYPAVVTSIVSIRVSIRPSVQHITHFWFTIQITIFRRTIIFLIVQRVQQTANVGKVQQVQQMGQIVSVRPRKNVLQHMAIVYNTTTALQEMVLFKIVHNVHVHY